MQGKRKRRSSTRLSVKLAKAKKKLVVHTRKKRLHAYFQPSKAPKYTEKQQQQPRWVPSKQARNIAAISQWINEYKGPSATVQCDDYCGRWRGISAELQMRSIASRIFCLPGLPRSRTKQGNKWPQDCLGGPYWLPVSTGALQLRTKSAQKYF